MLNTVFIFAGYGVSIRAIRGHDCYGKAICGATFVINVANVTNLLILLGKSQYLSAGIFICANMVENSRQL
jgi:hypothetical protein